jgi:hypothetical protein
MYTCVSAGGSAPVVEGFMFCKEHGKIHSVRTLNETDAIDKRVRDIAESMGRAEAKNTPANSAVHKPNHYVGRAGLEARTVMWEFDLPRHLAAALKYILRAGKKDPAKEREDIEKAQEYLRIHLEELSK